MVGYTAVLETDPTLILSHPVLHFNLLRAALCLGYEKVATICGKRFFGGLFNKIKCFSNRLSKS